MKVKSVSITRLRTNIREMLLDLKPDTVIAVTQHRDIIGFLTHPSAYTEKLGTMVTLCPHCEKNVAIPPRFILEEFKKRQQVKSMRCPHCYESLYVVRDLVPQIYLSGDKPRGFERIEIDGE